MKKYKLKYKNILILIILIFLVVIGYNYLLDNELEELKEEIKLNIDEDENFLNWVNDYNKDSFKNMSILLEDNAYDKSMWYDATGESYIVLQDKYNGLYNNNPHVTIVEGNSINITGDVALADNYHVMEAYYDRNEKLTDLLSQEIIDYFNSDSLTIINSEFAVGVGGEPLPNKYYTFIGKPDNIKLYHEMGVDLVTLANNHIYDYGHDVFEQTLDTFKTESIPYIGAGMNIDEADNAHYVIINGKKIAFINANRSEKYILTPGATETEAGVVRCYDPEYLMSMIEKEKEVSDYVIPIIHWGKEDSNEIEEVLLETSKMYIDIGADAIVGHHAHTLQGIEYYKGKPIFYNLGNFLFEDNDVDTGIVNIKVEDELKYYFIPATQIDVYTQFVSDDENERIWNKLESWSINTTITDKGEVLPIN